MPINPDNPILNAMSKAWDALIATLLFVLCALPMLTFGAALTALFSTLMAITKDECGGVVKKYFSVFSSEFRISTKAWLIFLAAGFLLGADVWACWFWADEAMVALSILKGITVFFGIAWLCAFSYVFSGIARYVVSLPQAFRNSLVLTVQNPGYTIILLALYLCSFAAIYLAGILAFPILVLILYWLAKVYVRVFDRTEKEVAS